MMFFFSPWFFLGEFFPNGPLAWLVSGVFYLVCALCVLYGIGYFSRGLRETPELRGLFPRILGSEDAWEGLFGSMSFLALILILYVVVLQGFHATGVVAWIVKAFILVLGLALTTQVVSAIDGLVIEPLIAAAAKGPEEFEPLIKRVRQVAALIGFVIALIAGIATIIQAF